MRTCGEIQNEQQTHKQSWRLNLKSTERNEQKAVIKTAVEVSLPSSEICRDFWSLATPVVHPDWHSPTDSLCAYEILWQLLQKTTNCVAKDKQI